MRSTLLFGLWLGLMPAGWAQAEEVAPDPLTDELASGVTSALAGDKKQAFDHLDRALLLDPEATSVQEVAGTAALLLGDRARARRILTRTPKMATYEAMAQVEGPGGLTRATTTLSQSARAGGRKATAGTLFLAALAFHRAGEGDRAQDLLRQALERAEGPLDEAFAPDPAVAMVRSALEALSARGTPSAERSIRFATALFEAGRRGEAVRMAERALADPKARAAALRILVLAENAVFARRALSRIERLLADEPEAQDAKIAKGVLLVRLGEQARAEKAFEAAAELDVPELQADRDRAKAELLLNKDGDPGAALDLAEAAVRADSKSDAAVGVMIRALLRAKKVERAEAFIGALLKRKPKDVDPFELLAQVHEARKEAQRASDNRLRSRAFKAAKQGLEREVERREQVLAAVRDAEGGVGATGLEALRSEHPTFELPIDLALAKRGSPGFARAARDRILAACGPALPALLRNVRGWDRVTVDVSLYGQVERLDAPLSSADPARCEAKKKRGR